MSVVNTQVSRFTSLSELRPATPEDAEMIVALEEEIFAEDPWTRAMIDEELVSPYSAYLLAFEGEMPLGYGGVKTVGDAADIMTIGVLPARRGRGVGRQLLNALIDEARTRGAYELFLDVRQSNARAQALYLSAGFSQIGTTRGYFRHPVEDALTMRLQISAK